MPPIRASVLFSPDLSPEQVESLKTELRQQLTSLRSFQHRDGRLAVNLTDRGEASVLAHRFKSIVVDIEHCY